MIEDERGEPKMKKSKPKMVMDVYDPKIRESLAVQNHFYKRMAESLTPPKVGDIVIVTFKLMKDQNEEK